PRLAPTDSLSWGERDPRRSPAGVGVPTLPSIRASMKTPLSGRGEKRGAIVIRRPEKPWGQPRHGRRRDPTSGSTAHRAGAGTARPCGYGADLGAFRFEIRRGRDDPLTIRAAAAGILSRRSDGWTSEGRGLMFPETAAGSSSCTTST